MPARKRTLHISLDPVKLLLCIALGIWLGCLAVVLMGIGLVLWLTRRKRA